MEELVVASTRYATRAETARTMKLLRLRKIQSIVGTRLPLEQLDDALELARAAEAFGRIMLDVAHPMPSLSS